MGKPLMIQEEDELRIENLKKRLGIQRKVDVLKAGIDLLEKQADRMERIQRWKRSAALMARTPRAERRIPNALQIERAMNREQTIRLLSELRVELAEKYAVKSLFLFGSICRDKAGPNSDVDLLVEFDRPVGYFGLFALQAYLESVFGCKVDLGTPNSLKPRIRNRVLGECVRVA